MRKDSRKTKEKVNLAKTKPFNCILTGGPLLFYVFESLAFRTIESGLILLVLTKDFQKASLWDLPK